MLFDLAYLTYSSKLIDLCVPSQKGLLLEAPHLQKEVVLSRISMLPSAFVTLTAPCTISGPLGFTSLVLGTSLLKLSKNDLKKCFLSRKLSVNIIPQIINYT